LFEVLECVDFALAAIGELAGLLLVGAVLRIPKSTPQLAFEVLLLTGNLFGLLGEVVDLIVGLLAPQAGQSFLGFFQSFSSALGFGFALWGSGLLGGSRLAHTLQRLLQTLDGLAHLLRTLTASAGRHLPLLALLTGLALLTLLALLSLLALLTLLILLLPLQLLDFALEFLGFAAKHFLLEPLLGNLLILARLIGELLLATGEFLELLEGVIDLLLTIAGLAAAAAGAFILVLLGVEFEIEESFEIAGAALHSTATASAVAESDLNVTARGFSTQQILQSLLLGPKASFQLAPFSLSAAGPMAATACSIS
jgi:hypothetical protein